MKLNRARKVRGACGITGCKCGLLSYETKEKALEILRNVYDTDETTDHFTGETTKEGRVR